MMMTSFSDKPAAPSSPITHSVENMTSTFLVSVHRDNSISLWKRSSYSWELVTILSLQKSTVTDIAFSPENNTNTFAVCKEDGSATVYTFAIATKTTISATANLCDSDTLSAIAFSDCGQLATLGDGVLRIYGRRWGLLTERDVEGKDVSFAPGGKAVIAGSTIFRCTRNDFEWNLFAVLDNSESVLSVDWGRDGLIGVGREDGVEIWELQRGEFSNVARFEEYGVQSVQWDTMGGLLTSSYKDGVTKTWGRDGATWELRNSVQPSIDEVA